MTLLRLTLLTLVCCSTCAAQNENVLHEFRRIQLTDTYFSEGANYGDINNDGVMDAVHGPYWFAGPDFQTKAELYPAVAQDRNRYANNFFQWIHDFDGDGWNDVLVVGFPGTPANVYRNPGRAGHGKAWPRHTIFDWVSNESPQFTNLVGDNTPELICTRDGHFGYVTIPPDKPLGRWDFHPISDRITATRFGHGLGVGDVNGDGRLDVLMKDGWFEQPADVSGDPKWTLHKVKFASPGGADMFAYDVDGDGDNDVITSLAAHDYGLAWHEQLDDGAFKQHTIMGRTPQENRYGVLFTEPHAVNLVDIDGDGLKDIVTGKTYWSHHKQSPMWDAGAVVYWFRLTRGEDGVDWVPYLADGESGIGRQLTVGDVNGDQLPDIVVGGMKGAHVLIHQRRRVSHTEWEAAQPQPHRELAAGLTPEEAARNMSVPPGFRVQLAAGEPMVHQPIAFTFDDRGRLWLAEAHTYPIRAEDGQGKDRIVILEDTDLDGDFDKRTVFIEGLNLVSGLEVGFGGVFVGAAPYLMFIPDRDGDDKPDAPRPERANGPAPPIQFPKDVPPGATVLLDGFGWQDTHETLNAFIWGPDGWLYGCHGVFTHSRVGRPGTPDNKRTPLNAGVWRFHPKKHTFEVFAHGTSNPWGVDFNEKGDAFITACVIPHLYHMIQGGRYQRQGGQHFNPHTFDDIKTIADHLHYTGNIRDHAWWGHEPSVPKGTDDAGGGHAHAGAMVYLGDNWPEEYRGRLFFNNIHGNRVNCDILESEGSGYVGHHGRDLVKANDRWFRGINLKYAPDGSVYLIDWYDKNACHRRNPEIWDRTNGRIYRIVYGDRKPKRVHLSKLSNLELVKLQSHSNEWYVRMARRLLQERNLDPESDEVVELIDAVHDVLMSRADAERPNEDWAVLRSLWVLHAMGALEESGLDRDMLECNWPHVAAWAIRLTLEDGTLSDNARKMLLYRANVRQEPDNSTQPRMDSPVVRRALASGLMRLPLKDRWDIASALVGHGEDASDHNLPLLYWYAIEPLVEADPVRVMELAVESKIPLIRRYIYRRAASDPKLINHVVAALTDGDDAESHELILDEMSRAFEGRVDIPMPPAWKPAYEKLARSKSAVVLDKADRIAILLGDARIFPRMRARLVDQRVDMKKRREALDILVRAQDRGSVDAWLKVLDEAELRGPSIRALAAFEDPRTAPSIISRYAALTEAERRDAVSTLVARRDSAMKLLDAIAAKTVPSTDLHAYHIRELDRFDDAKLRERIRTVWGEMRESSADKKARIAELKTMLQAKHSRAPDLGNGRRVFDKTCASCHTLFGAGGKVGPDITGSNRANLDYILENIVDPSAVMGRDYRMSSLVLEDGRQVNGLIQKETDSALTVRTINDTVVVAKDEIEHRKLSDQSLMPDRLLEAMSTDEVRDLVAYLASPAQVASKGPRSPIDAKTNRVPGAIEGESMKILAKTAGDARSQPMGGFKTDRWSNNDHLWWTGAKPGAELTVEVPVAAAGTYDLEIVLTKARDYGAFQLLLDDREIGTPIDLFNSPAVITTGVLTIPIGTLEKGPHRLTARIVGANPRALKSYMFGLDYVRLQKK